MKISKPSISQGNIGRYKIFPCVLLTLLSPEIFTDEVCEALVNAKNVIIVPGYGLCAARAQYPVAEIAKLLNSKGVK